MTAQDPSGSDRGITLTVDARALQASGLGRYLRSILDGLLDDPRFTSITLLGDPGELQDFIRSRGSPGHVVAIPLPVRFYSPVSQLEWQLLLGRGIGDADVTFVPHYDVPLAGLSRRSVVTIHDLIHFEVPHIYSGWRTRAASLLLRRAVSQAGTIIVVSDATRRDLLRRHPQVAHKVRVIHNGVSSNFRPGSETPTVEQLNGRPFILCVGNRKPHKNLTAAVEVLSRMRKRVGNLCLVVVGKAYPGADEVRKRAAELDVESALIELDDVSEGELQRLYSASALLLFPSLYEGFGLPVLEAMASGAPVIASNRSSLPEVVGDAGVLFDPQDFEGMAEAGLQLILDEAYRSELRRRGLARSSEFTWGRAAERTADLLAEAAGVPAGTARVLAHGQRYALPGNPAAK